MTCVPTDSSFSFSDCRYGDRELDVCQNVEAYMCYDSAIRNRCCGTCAAFDTGRQGKYCFEERAGQRRAESNDQGWDALYHLVAVLLTLL